MSALSRFVGGAPTTAIVNRYSSGGVVSAVAVGVQESNNAREVLSGALTAATLATALSVSGSGEVPWLSVYTKDATNRTVRVRVSVDGAVIFDATSASTTTPGTGMIVVGQVSAASYTVAGAVPLRFNTSLMVEIASSLTETDKVAIGYVLHKR